MRECIDREGQILSRRIAAVLWIGSKVIDALDSLPPGKGRLATPILSGPDFDLQLCGERVNKTLALGIARARCLDHSHKWEQSAVVHVFLFSIGEARQPPEVAPVG